MSYHHIIRLAGLLGILTLGGCAATDVSTDDINRNFQEGVHGQGKIVPVEEPATRPGEPKQ